MIRNLKHKCTMVVVPVTGNRVYHEKPQFRGSLLHNGIMKFGCMGTYDECIKMCTSEYKQILKEA